MAIISLETRASCPKINAPPPGVSADEHAKAWREIGYQADHLDYCFYCEGPGHGSAGCKYLNPAVRISDWHPDPRLWVYRENENNGNLGRPDSRPNRNKEEENTDDQNRVIKTEPSDIVGNDDQAASFQASATPLEIAGDNAQAASFSTQGSSGFTYLILNLDLVPLPTDYFAPFNIPRHHWAITVGYYRHVANNKDCFVDYHEYSPWETPYRFRDLNGTIRTAVGVGSVRINTMLEIGIRGELILDAVYCPGPPFNLISLDRARQVNGLHYQVPTYGLHELSTDELVAHIFEENYILFLRTILE
jgi:hypothetical protein